MQESARTQFGAVAFNLPDENYEQVVLAQQSAFTAVFAHEGKRHKVRVQPPPPVQEEIDEIDEAEHLGPSMIIAFGDFTRWEFWIMDQNGDAKIEVKDLLRGYGNLPVGSKVTGKIHDIRNKWFQFDGTIPHATLPIKSQRISLVYFTGNKYHTMQESARTQLGAAAFNLPDENYEQVILAQQSAFTGIGGVKLWDCNDTSIDAFREYTPSSRRECWI